MKKIEETDSQKTDLGKLMDMVDLCNKTMGPAAGNDALLQKALEVSRAIRNVRRNERTDTQEFENDRVVIGILEEAKEEIKKMRLRDDLTIVQMNRRMNELAHQWGLMVVLKAPGVETTTGNLHHAQYRIRIENRDLFCETLESIQPPKEDLLRLAEGLKEDIFAADSEGLINSKTFEALAIIADQKSVQDDPFLSRTKEITRAPATDMKNPLKKIAIQLFLEFEKKIGIRLRVISTGDANLIYLQETDAFMEAWLEKAKWTQQNPAYALYATKMNFLFEQALWQYIQVHIRIKAPGFEEAKIFAMDRGFRKQHRM